jgi:hypothetical protein
VKASSEFPKHPAKEEHKSAADSHSIKPLPFSVAEPPGLTRRSPLAAFVAIVRFVRVAFATIPTGFHFKLTLGDVSQMR